MNPPGGTYPEQALITLTAVPDPGWMFDSWGINLSGSQNPETLLMDSNKSISVKFVESTDVSESRRVNRFILHQNHPNPFNAQTSITFSLKQQGWTTLTIYDAMGEEIDVLVDGKLPEGEHHVVYNASLLASGVYFYRIQSGYFQDMKKMMYVK